jgi:hypothetical protein
MFLLTPKPNFSPPLPINYFGAIYGPTIFCILLHILTARPEAGEAMRGYLHGGVIIDLIGYKGPTSKLHLLCLDVLVFALQCLMLTVQVELKMVKMILAVVRSNPASGSQAGVQVVSVQDHDAEEQGIVREGILNAGNIEMRALSPRVDRPSAHDEAEADADHDHSQLLEDPPPQSGADQDNILDAMWSGSAIIADFHVISTIQRLGTENRFYSGFSSMLQSIGISTEVAAQRANRQLDVARRRLQQLQSGADALGD